MLWKDGGFSLVLSDGIQQHPQHCSSQSQHGGVQGCRMEKGVLVAPVAAFMLRLWPPLLWKRFADPVTHSLACSTPSGRERTRGQREALGPYSMLLGAALAACTFSFNNMN